MRDTDNSTVLLHGAKLRETEKAIHFSVQYVETKEWTKAENTFWFPISQISEAEYNPYKAGEDTIRIPLWLAQTKGFV